MENLIANAVIDAVAIDYYHKKNLPSKSKSRFYFLYNSSENSNKKQPARDESYNLMIIVGKYLSSDKLHDNLMELLNDLFGLSENQNKLLKKTVNLIYKNELNINLIDIFNSFSHIRLNIIHHYKHAISNRIIHKKSCVDCRENSSYLTGQVQDLVNNLSIPDEIQCITDSLEENLSSLINTLKTTVHNHKTQLLMNSLHSDHMKVLIDSIYEEKLLPNLCEIFLPKIIEDEKYTGVINQNSP